MATSSASPNAAKTIVDPVSTFFHQTSSNYEESSNPSAGHTKVKAQDGRRNSKGVITPSSADYSSMDTWKPDLDRKQSWKAEDWKNMQYKNQFGIEDGKGPQGQGTGFTEGGEGTRKV